MWTEEKITGILENDWEEKCIVKLATAPKDFRFGNFVGSLIRLILWILVIVTLVGLPLIFIILFYVPLPPVNGEVLDSISLFLNDGGSHKDYTNNKFLDSY